MNGGTESSHTDNKANFGSKKQIIRRLFVDTIVTSTLAFGGGFVVLGMIREKFVKKYGWMTDEEMADMLAIAQSAPGTIAGNALMLVGYNMAGVAGAIVTMIASIIPPLVIITLVAMFYNYVRDSVIAQYLLRGMQTGVGAVILSLCVDMVRDVTKRGKDIAAVVMMAIALVASFIIKINAIYIILAGAVAGIAVTFYRIKLRKKKAKEENTQQ